MPSSTQTLEHPAAAAADPTLPSSTDAAAEPTQQSTNGHEASTSGRTEEQQQQQTPLPPTGYKRYLCYFLYRLLDFRVPELHQLAGMCGVEQPVIEPLPEDVLTSCGDVWPIRFVHLPGDEAATSIAHRGVLIKGMFEVWGEGSSLSSMLSAVASYPSALKAPYLAPSASFKVVLSTVGFKWRPQQHADVIQALEGVGFEGRVDLVAPQHLFWVITIESDGQSGMPEMPTRWLFARQVAVGDRSLLQSYALPQRAYIGPTSMDPELAFIMTNMAQITPSSLAMDPYAGTGSILVAAAARGAWTVGGDIDHRVVMAGKTHPVSGDRLDIFSNYAQYGLTWPVGLLRMDVHRHPFRRGLTEVFDAILGDPPYGVRAGGRKSYAKPGAYILDRPSHIPSTAPYSLTECLADLLEFAAMLLVTGGHLVFWMPSSPDLYSDDELPRHPCMSLLHNSEQILTSRYSRRLITMVKTKPYDADEAAAFKASRQDYVMALDKLSELVYSKAEGGSDGGGSAVSSSSGSKQQRDGEQQLTRGGIPKFRGKHY